MSSVKRSRKAAPKRPAGVSELPAPPSKKANTRATAAAASAAASAAAPGKGKGRRKSAAAVKEEEDEAEAEPEDDEEEEEKEEEEKEEEEEEEEEEATADGETSETFAGIKVLFGPAVQFSQPVSALRGLVAKHGGAIGKAADVRQTSEDNRVFVVSTCTCLGTPLTSQAAKHGSANVVTEEWLHNCIANGNAEFPNICHLLFNPSDDGTGGAAAANPGFGPTLAQQKLC